DIDAGAALVALEMVAFVGRDLRHDAAVDDTERTHAHTFITDADAAEAKDAARRIEKHYRGKLLLGSVDLFFSEPALARAVAEHHILQFALAALVAYRAVERMVAEEEFESILARLRHLRGFGPDHHAFGHGKRACRHQLRHFLHFHEAHPAGGLQSQSF